MRCTREYIVKLKQPNTSLDELLLPVIEFLCLDKLNIDFSSIKSIEDLTKLIQPPQNYTNKEFNISNIDFAKDSQCQLYFEIIKEIPDANNLFQLLKNQQITDLQNIILNSNKLASIALDVQNSNLVIQERIVRCFIIQVLTQISNGCIENLFIQEQTIKVTKTNKKQTVNAQENAAVINENINQLVILNKLILQYLLACEPVDQIIEYFLEISSLFKPQYIKQFADKNNDVIQQSQETINLLLQNLIFQQNEQIKLRILKILKTQTENQFIIEQLLKNDNIIILNNQLLDQNINNLTVVLNILSLISKQQNSNFLLTTFTNLQLLILSDQKQTRNIVFKLFPFSLQQLYQIFYDLFNKQIIHKEQISDYFNFLLLDQEYAFDNDEIQVFLNSEVDDEYIKLSMVVQVVNNQQNTLFNEQLAKQLVISNNSQLFLQLNIYTNMEQYLQQSEYKFLMQISDEQKDDLFKQLQQQSSLQQTASNNQLLQILAEKEIYPNQQVLNDIIQQNLFTQQDQSNITCNIQELTVKLLYLLKLKQQGKYDISLFDKFISNMWDVIQNIIQQLQYQYYQQISQLLIHTLFGFPKFLKSQNLINIVIEQLVCLFINFYNFKYIKYDELDVVQQKQDTQQESELLNIIQEIDDIQRQFLEMFVRNTDTVKSSKDIYISVLFIICMDHPVNKQWFSKIMNVIDVENHYQTLIQLIKQINSTDYSQYSQNKKQFLQQSDILQDFSKLASTYYKIKMLNINNQQIHDLKKEWVRITLYCEERGITGVGKGLGDEGKKIVDELLKKRQVDTIQTKADELRDDQLE